VAFALLTAGCFSIAARDCSTGTPFAAVVLTPATVDRTAGGFYNGMAIRSVSPTISGDPTPAVLGKAYDYALTVGGNPAPTVRLEAGRLPVGS
jgi:hypothetical protein